MDWKRDIIGAVRAALGDQLPAAILMEMERLVSSLEALLSRHDLPRADQSAAVSTVPRTAALVFDRVWYPPAIGKAPPPEISFYAATPFEAVGICVSRLCDDFGLCKTDEEALIREINKIDFGIHIRQGEPSPPKIAAAIAATHKITATPVLASSRARQHEYQPGERAVIVAALAGIGVVDERQLSWEQIQEFRADAVARSTYRRMVHWLDNEMRGRTAAFIADELAIRLEDYEWSLRKHGIATVTGTLEHLLDAKFLGAGSAVVAALGLTAGGATAAFVGGTFIAGKMIVEITHAAVELIDKRRQAVGPIAFVHELRKRAL